MRITRRMCKMAALPACMSATVVAVFGLLLLTNWAAIRAGHDSAVRVWETSQTSAWHQQLRCPLVNRTMAQMTRKQAVNVHLEVEKRMRARIRRTKRICNSQSRTGNTENILIYVNKKDNSRNDVIRDDVKRFSLHVTNERFVKSYQSHGHVSHSRDSKGTKRKQRLLPGKTRVYPRKWKPFGRTWVSRRGKDQGMSYCVVPKAGCTFWIRIFRFLNRDTGGINISSPFDINRSQAHDAGHRKMKMYRLSRAEDRTHIFRTKRILFARDPFSRVYSAYLDKFFLPDYWTRVGKRIVREQRENPGERSSRCGHDVTFVEFLRHIVTTSVKSGPRSLDGHWRPIEFQCSPCVFRPDYIGLHETFASDAKYVLQEHGLRHVWAAYDHSSHVLDEMQINTQYMFSKAAPLIRKNCTTAKELIARLWEVFKINGYIPVNATLGAYVEKGIFGSKSFVNFISRTYSGRRRRSLEDTSLLRRAMLARAYSNVPRNLLHQIVGVYAMDFRYFGYDAYPPT